VVNSPFYVLQEPETNDYYLRGGTHWYVASDLTGEWEVTDDLPGSVAWVAWEIERREDEQATDDDLEYASWRETEGAVAPEIFVRTRPAEIIQTDGEPEFASIEGTDLLYMRNTESDVVMDIGTQRYFVLASGRWYTSRSMTGGVWDHVPNDELPADFAKIPAGSDMASVRASVAGTPEAREAVLESSVPQTAEVDRRTATVRVEYDGDPVFQRCATGVAYAINTRQSVLLVDGWYYCCDDAIWFVSDGPEGPWEVATWVPDEIQDIPPECPVYNVKYVYIYDSTPDVVYVGYTPGYFGSYVYRGCVVYGTGYWYDPWYDYYYYPRPATWGYGVHWVPYSGWGFSFGMSFGWLHIGFGRPWYGGWWGPAGYCHGYRHGYHHGYHDGYHDGHYAWHHDGYHHGHRRSGGRNLFRHRDKGVLRTGTVFVGGPRPEPGHGAGYGEDYVGTRGGGREIAHATRRTPDRGIAPVPQREDGRDVAHAAPQVSGGRDATRETAHASPGVVSPTPTKPSRLDRAAEIRKPKPVKKPNDVYAGSNGEIYRRQGDAWQRRDAKEWSPAKPSPKRSLERDERARKRGDVRTEQRIVRSTQKKPAKKPEQKPPKKPARKPPKKNEKRVQETPRPSPGRSGSQPQSRPQSRPQSGSRPQGRPSPPRSGGRRG